MRVRKSRLSHSKQEELIKLFVAGATARASAQLVGVQANTAIKFFMNLRELIASKQPSPNFSLTDRVYTVIIEYFYF